MNSARGVWLDLVDISSERLSFQNCNSLGPRSLFDQACIKIRFTMLWIGFQRGTQRAMRKPRLEIRNTTSCLSRRARNKALKTISCSHSLGDSVGSSTALPAFTHPVVPPTTF